MTAAVVAGCRGHDPLPFRNMSAQAFAQDVLGAMRRDGWTLRRQKPPRPDHRDGFLLRHLQGAVAGDMYTAPYGTASVQAAMGIHSQCFSPGSAKPSTVQFQQFPLPHPSSTPSGPA